MKLRAGDAYWPDVNPPPSTPPRLTGDTECEVVILGGGVTGALIAERLTEAGLGSSTVLLDKRPFGGGSTSASTALCQYELDQHLRDLSRCIGERDAERAYTLCVDAVRELGAIADALPQRCGLERRPSLYLGSKPQDVADLRDEVERRRAIGIDAVFVPRDELRSAYGIDRPCAIRSAEAAQIDPYGFTLALLQRAMSRGLRLYSPVTVAAVDRAAGGFVLTSDQKVRVRCRTVILATGYESQQYLRQRVARLRSTFALASAPLRDREQPPWRDGCLIWETSRPYLYLRTTPDGRVLVGGGDEDFHDQDASRALIPRKTEELLAGAAKLFPLLKLEVDYAWSGVFGDTGDSLPFIGQSPEFPGAWFALGYGANGTIFSLIAANLIRAALRGEPSDDLRLFRFEREVKF